MSIPEPGSQAARRGRWRRRLVAEINVVPYIDVMLVLLVIFMITAPLLQQGVAVELPQAAAEPIPAEVQEPVLISVDKDGQIFVGFGPREEQERPLDKAQLLHRVAAIHKLNPELRFYLKGDRRVPYGDIVRIIAVLKGAGVPGVGLLTRSPPRVETP